MSKTVTVRYFALFRENAGVAEETVTLDAVTAADLYQQLSHRHGSLDAQDHCKVAINDEMSDWSSPIKDGDIVLLFPPVAGG